MEKIFLKKWWFILSIGFFTSNINLQAQCNQRYLDKVFSSFDFTPAIAFGDVKTNFEGTQTRMLFNLFEPKGDTLSERPVVILYHGGSFRNDPPIDRRSPEISELARDLSKKGYVVILPDYRIFGGDVTYEKMATTIFAAFLDMQQLLCYLKDSYENGNPYRLDTSKIVLGGSSAGAILPLNFSEFVNDTSEIPEDLKLYAEKAAHFDGLEVQDILNNKFCGLKTKGIVSISGAILDKSIIRPTAIPFYAVHGMKDEKIFYNEGHALGKDRLPIVYGPGSFAEDFHNMGIELELDAYPDAYHVPILQPFGDDLELALANVFTTGNIFIDSIMDSTKNHLTRFLYKIVGSPNDCEVTSVKNHTLNGVLKIYPNPSNGDFTIHFPHDYQGRNGFMQIMDISGRTVYEDKFQLSGNTLSLHLSEKYSGFYFLNFQIQESENTVFLSEKICLNR